MTPVRILCECCSNVAVRRVKGHKFGQNLSWFSCSDHHDKIDFMSAATLGRSRKETVTNPAGFADPSGRMLGPRT